MEKIFLKGEIVIPPDKSITHRGLIFGALTKYDINIKNVSLGKDCLATLKILERLGVRYRFTSKRNLILNGSRGIYSDKDIVLNCANSGTTARLLLGLLSGLDFTSILIGDESLMKRPMKRVIEPLKLMGADISSKNNKLPIKVRGTHLEGITHHSLIPSAQVKSCLMLAGLQANGKTVIKEDILSRNHSEIMLKYLGADILAGKDKNYYFTKIQRSELTPLDIEIPGDISSAAFFMVAAAIVPDSHIIIKNVGINPTRTGIIDVFEQAEIDFEIFNEREVNDELICDIEINYTEKIKPFRIEGDIIPRLIDEIPILAVLAACAEGKSEIKDAQDLRNKESDRIKSIVDAFSSLGIEIEEKPDGFIIEGPSKLNKTATLRAHLDHRLAMSYYVLSLINKRPIEIEGFECVETSFPEFLELMETLKQYDD